MKALSSNGKNPRALSIICIDSICKHLAQLLISASDVLLARRGTADLARNAGGGCTIVRSTTWAPHFGDHADNRAGQWHVGLGFGGLRARVTDRSATPSVGNTKGGGGAVGFSLNTLHSRCYARGPRRNLVRPPKVATALRYPSRSSRVMSLGGVRTVTTATPARPITSSEVC